MAEKEGVRPIWNVGQGVKINVEKLQLQEWKYFKVDRNGESNVPTVVRHFESSFANFATTLLESAVKS